MEGIDMTTGLYKKGLVLGIICLFFGASIVPSIAGYDKDVEKNDYMLSENEALNMKNDERNNLIKQVIESGVISNDDWLQQDKLLYSDGAADDWFGCSVSIDGDYAIVGASGDGINGAAYVSSYVQAQIGLSRRSCLLQTEQPVAVLVILFQSMETMSL
jgi:hypothetical protein